MENRIRELRKKNGWSQAELAARLGISQSAIGMYEQGRREPDTRNLLRIARIFNVSVDYLIGASMLEGQFDPAQIAHTVAGDLMEQPALMFSADCYTEQELADIRAVIEQTLRTALAKNINETDGEN